MSEPIRPDDLLGGETTVRWVPHLNDPTRPTAEEIAAGTVIGTAGGPPNLAFARDEDASTDPRTLMEGHVARFRVRRDRLDPTCEVVQISALPEPDPKEPAARFEVRLRAADDSGALPRLRAAALGEPGASLTSAECRHPNPTPMQTETGELIAHLCLACESLLPPGRPA